MALYINKVFNACGAWGRLEDEYQAELIDIHTVLNQLDNLDYRRESKEFISEKFSSLNWKSRYFLPVGGLPNYGSFKGPPKRVSMLAIKGHIGVDGPMANATYFDSWVTYKAKSASSLGYVSLMLLPLLGEEDRSRSITFEYAVERAKYLEIAEGSQFVLLGISSVPSNMEIIEADSVSRRTITFEPHQVQAGVGLLSYFSEILKQKCSEANSKVSIEQDGETVRLMIKSEAGLEHKVEALLNEYGEVLNGSLAPETFMTDQIQLLALRNKLDMAAMEVKHYQERMSLVQSNYEQRVFSLEEQVTSLNKLLSESITSHRIAQEHVSNLIDKYGKESEVELELISLAKKLDERATDVKKEELENIVRQINSENPKLANEFLTLLRGPLEGVVGNIIYSWLPQLGGIIGTAIR
ncbi:hypothetical protein EKG38_14615 [Shewanella canadensis]|uniref:Uncharacterized protein n=1 Tax=Shewanella canadensis TaxID=271096 RepID=A0A3S0KTR6_9GAMM|nr:hypothetical protein [Shewanella canadensis]RTR38194.1 hypothetical protein EKG38_14615 [Shewanella canadensis]